MRAKSLHKRIAEVGAGQDHGRCVTTTRLGQQTADERKTQEDLVSNFLYQLGFSQNDVRDFTEADTKIRFWIPAHTKTAAIASRSLARIVDEVPGEMTCIEMDLYFSPSRKYGSINSPVIAIATLAGGVCTAWVAWLWWTHGSFWDVFSVYSVGGGA